MNRTLSISCLGLILIVAGCATSNEELRAPTAAPVQRVAMSASPHSSPVFDVRAFGAAGNGETLDSGAINKAIEAAESSGGGTVYFPAGNYLSVSIRLKSNIALSLDRGATIVAADPKQGFKYDAPELNAFEKFQDFGHSH